MNKEEIKHFKSLLRQGSLRHMNILLDDKFQKELLNIIKNYEKLQTENQQLKLDYELYKDNHTYKNYEVERKDITIKQLKSTLEEIREYINNYDVFKEFSFPLMKREEENQVKSSIDYEFQTTIKKNLLQIIDKGVK